MLLPGAGSIPAGDAASGLHPNPADIQPILGKHPRTPLPFSFYSVLNFLLKFQFQATQPLSRGSPCTSRILALLMERRERRNKRKAAKKRDSVVL